MALVTGADIGVVIATLSTLLSPGVTIDHSSQSYSIQAQIKNGTADLVKFYGLRFTYTYTVVGG